jgi:hypothetical protein
MATETFGNLDELAAILLTLKIGQEQALFVMLSSDGAINRLGTGAVDNNERTMCIGKTDTSLFERLRSMVTPELLQFGGQMLSDPNPKGQPCKLMVGFKKKDGKELMIGFGYGSESQGPPPAVCKFVLAAVDATEPWYKEQMGSTKAGS